MSSGSEGDGKIVDVVLAEFAALRTEIVHKIGQQLTVVSINITGAAAVGGFVLANKADARLLLLLPYLSAALGLYYRAAEHDFTTIGRYIDQIQRPLLVEKLGDERLFRYESFFREQRYGRGVVLGLAIALIFPVMSIAALVLVIPALGPFADWAIWIAGVIFTLLQSVAWRLPLDQRVANIINGIIERAIPRFRRVRRRSHPR
jgi:hypothetical protein